MYDLGILVMCLIMQFFEFYKNFVLMDYNYKNCVFLNVNNCNLLFGLGIGVDGLKIGYMQEVGYGLVGLVMQGDCCVVFVIIGLFSEKVCVEEVEWIVNWVYCQFIMCIIVFKGDIVV